MSKVGQKKVPTTEERSNEGQNKVPTTEEFQKKDKRMSKECQKKVKRRSCNNFPTVKRKSGNNFLSPIQQFVAGPSFDLILTYFGLLLTFF